MHHSVETEQMKTVCFVGLGNSLWFLQKMNSVVEQTE